MLGENAPSPCVALLADLAQDPGDGEIFADLLFDRLAEGCELAGSTTGLLPRDKAALLAQHTAYDLSGIPHPGSDFPGAVEGMQPYDFALDLEGYDDLPPALLR